MIVCQAFNLDFSACGSENPIRGARIKEFDKFIQSDIANISMKEGSSTWLHEAVELGYEQVNKIIKRIVEDLKKGIKYAEGFPNSTDANGWTALGLAIKKGDIEILKLLCGESLKTKSRKKEPIIDINKAFINKEGQEITSLLVALLEDKQDIANYLLSLHQIDTTTKHPDTGETPLHVISRGVFSTSKPSERLPIETLLANLTKKGKNILLEQLLAENKEKRTPLALAAAYNNVHDLRVLFDKIKQVVPDKDQLREILFKRDSEDHDIFKLSYLRVPGFMRALTSDDDKDFIFKDVLENAKDYLHKDDWKKILGEIIKETQEIKIGQPSRDELIKKYREVNPDLNESKKSKPQKRKKH